MVSVMVVVAADMLATRVPLFAVEGGVEPSALRNVSLFVRPQLSPGGAGGLLQALGGADDHEIVIEADSAPPVGVATTIGFQVPQTASAFEVMSNTAFRRERRGESMGLQWCRHPQS